MIRRLHPQPQQRRPSVSVVLPCYNYGDYLPTAVTSVLEQPGVDIELIVIDDASLDGSADVVRSLAADDRIHPILHSSNRGHIATYNEGLQIAGGEYVVLLSADDALTPGSLLRATALLESHPSVGFVYGFPVEFADALPPVAGDVRDWTIWPGGEWIKRICRTGRNSIFSPEVVMRSSVQRDIGGYDPELPLSGDLEMWLRAGAVSDVGRINGAAQAYYRVHDTNMHLTTYSGLITDLEARLAAFEKALTRSASHLSRSGELRATARYALALDALDNAARTLDRGEAESGLARDYMTFACHAWPQISETRRWRVLVRRVETHPGRLTRRVGPVARHVVDDAKGRVLWRRWRRTGVWGQARRPHRWAF
jgi:glycosyltransferase involved in cell wall biosynthesis